LPLLDNECVLDEFIIAKGAAVSFSFEESSAKLGKTDSASSLDFAISASCDACRASSCVFGWGDRGGRLLIDRAEERLEGVLFASCDGSKSCAASDDDSVEFEVWSNGRMPSCRCNVFNRA
jgi:hypothetical protein